MRKYNTRAKQTMRVMRGTKGTHTKRLNTRFRVRRTRTKRARTGTERTIRPLVKDSDGRSPDNRWSAKPVAKSSRKRTSASERQRDDKHMCQTDTLFVLGAKRLKFEDQLNKFFAILGQKFVLGSDSSCCAFIRYRRRLCYL